MAPTPWQRKLEEAQELTNRGARSEFGEDYSTAFQCYVRAGELYLWLVKESTSVGERPRLKAAAEKVLKRAETIKQVRKDVRAVERRPLSIEEQAKAVEAGAKVDSILVPEWKAECCQPGPSKLVRSEPPLSPKQTERGTRYKRRSDGPSWAQNALYHPERPLRGKHIVQRVVTDCSFVAALEVAAEHDSRWSTSLAHAPLYPKDALGHPTWSESNVYSVRLLYNGKDRCISVDDSIPCYPDGTPICATGIVGDTLQVWPSLLEKAYISLRGGYDFGGSNSSIDLHALTGWIPEQVGFQHAGFQREKEWARVKGEYDKGHLMVTAGTTRDMERRRLPGQARLIDSHNYAVLDLKEEDGERWLILMNPWETGPDREVLTMSWTEACARLDSLYLNWSPSLFDQCLTWHGLWNVGAVQSPSVQIVAKETCEVWLLLTRHVTTTTTTTKPGSTEWIALHVFGSNDAHTTQRSGVYVDSSHTLVRVKMRPGERRIAASRQGGSGQASFTLFVYSPASVRLQDVPTTAYPHTIPIKGQWTRKNAGGNAAQPTFLHNPQYVVTVPARTNFLLIVETSRDVAVQVAMLWSRGRRVGQMTQGDLVTSSGIYNYGLAMAEAMDVKAGQYTIVVSTFEAGQLGDFDIRVQSDQQVQVDAIAAEGAGMFHQRFRDAWRVGNAVGGPRHADYFSNPTFEIQVEHPSTVLLRLLVQDSSGLPRPLTSIAVFARDSKQEIVSSGPYSDPVCGVSIGETRLDSGSYSVIVSTYDAGVLADFMLEVYSERRIACKKI